MFQFSLVRNHKSENITHCALLLLLQNKLRAFQIERRARHGKGVTSNIVSVESAVRGVGGVVVYASLVSLPHKGHVREP